LGFQKNRSLFSVLKKTVRFFDFTGFQGGKFFRDIKKFEL
jgi:hypothetical protein